MRPIGVARRTYWWLSRPARARPTFLVIGAQRSGTSSLRQYLAEHPAILCAEPKEVHYFDIAYRHGELWYLSHFPWWTEGRNVRRRYGIHPAVGEATPEYFFFPWVPERVRAFAPDLRFIVLLRDPVERAYSQYQMQVRARGETHTFEEALDLEEAEWAQHLDRLRTDDRELVPSASTHSYVARGMYAEQLERWYGQFQRDQFLVLCSEQLFADSADGLSRIAAFLGVPEWRVATYPRLSEGNYRPMAPGTRERLARHFEPHNRRLEALLDVKLNWTRPQRDSTVRR